LPIDTRNHSKRCSLSLVELLKLLLLEGSGLGELKVDLVGGQLLVGMGDGVEFVLNLSLVQRVKIDGLGEAGGLANTRATANDAGWHDDVVEDSGVHGSEGARSGALLAGVGDLLGGVNRSVDNNNDGPLELVLEVVDHLLVGLLEELERSVGDLDQDVLGGGTLVVLELNFLDGVDVDHAQVLLDVLVGLLESGEGLSGLFLELGGLDLNHPKTE